MNICNLAMFQTMTAPAINAVWDTAGMEQDPMMRVHVVVATGLWKDEDGNAYIAGQNSWGRHGASRFASPSRHMHALAPL